VVEELLTTANENHLGEILEIADFLQDPAKIFLLHIERPDADAAALFGIEAAFGFATFGLEPECGLDFYHLRY